MNSQNGVGSGGGAGSSCPNASTGIIITSTSNTVVSMVRFLIVSTFLLFSVKPRPKHFNFLVKLFANLAL